MAKTNAYTLATDLCTLDTILAALRAWQLVRADHDDINDIASEHGEPLSTAEIDALCEALNCGDIAIVYQSGSR